MINCVSPITLKSGLVVPCGKCELCLSHRRNDWSVRLQLHADSYERMPLFLTLTYDDSHLVYADDKPTLVRSDISSFIKRYKDRYNLYNTDFTYFGCGEYGDKFGRPHYHLLVFGDDELNKLFDEDSEVATKRVMDVWQKGFVYIGVASWSGVHYVTKYVLKENPEDYVGEYIKPFTLCSHGIGINWLKSDEALRIKDKLYNVTIKRDEFDELLDSYNFDVSNLGALCSSLRDVVNRFSTVFPSFNVVLPSGQRAFVPRDLRRRLVGSFEHFKDNPLWKFNSLSQLLDSCDYYRQHGANDLESDLPASMQSTILRVLKINKRLIENKHKKLSYASI